MLFAIRRGGIPRNRETGNVAVEGLSWDQGNISRANTPMRAQTTASGGYCTVQSVRGNVAEYCIVP